MTGAALRRLRLRLGLTQEQFGRRLDLSRKSVIRYEAQRNVPRWLSIAATCLANHGA